MDHAAQRLGVAAKTGIVRVLALSVTIAEDAAVGPAVIEVFHSLLKHLRLSAEQQEQQEQQGQMQGQGQVQGQDSDNGGDPSEEEFREVVLEAASSFAAHLTSTQKVEIMIFIIGKIPTTAVARARVCLLRCLIQVARVYEVSWQGRARRGHMAL